MSTLVAVPQSSLANVWSVIAKTFLHAFLICLGVIVIYPLIWMALNGFKNNAQIFGDPLPSPRLVVDQLCQAWNQGVRDYARQRTGDRYLGDLHRSRQCLDGTG